MMTKGPATLENRAFEIAVGDSASVTKTLTRGIAAVSGDVNPIHLDERLDGGLHVLG